MQTTLTVVALVVVASALTAPAGTSATLAGPADSLNCDLTEYKGLPGLTASLADDVLSLTWDGDRNQELRLGLAIASGTPTIRDLAIRPKRGRWKPEEIKRATATYQADSCAVKTNGARLEVTFPGVQMGVFAGRLQFTVYKGTNLIRQEVIAKTEEHGMNPVNYVKVDPLPRPDDMTPLINALKRGDYFATTGEVLIPSYAVQGTGAQRTVVAEVEWTFPLEFVELVWGDGQKTDREIIPATDLPPFGRKRFQIPFAAAGKKWVRFAAWDSAGNGALVQPIRLVAPTSTPTSR